jgi:hypothetical protein
VSPERIAVWTVALESVHNSLVQVDTFVGLVVEEIRYEYYNGECEWNH